MATVVLNRLKTWYLRNLEWEQKHRKFMICLRAFIALLVIAVNVRAIQIILSFSSSLRDALPILIPLYSAILITGLLIFFLYRKLKNSTIQ